MMLAFAGGTWYGTGLGEDRENDIVTKAGEAAQLAAAGEIAKSKPHKITLRQELGREIQTRVEYRDCRHGPDGLRLINEALTGRPQPVAGGHLHGADALSDDRCQVAGGGSALPGVQRCNHRQSALKNP